MRHTGGRGWLRQAVAGAAAAALGAATLALLRRRVPAPDLGASLDGGSFDGAPFDGAPADPGTTPTPPDRWHRRNFAGAPVDLFGGPATVVGLATGSLAGGDLRNALVALGSGGVGLLDDLCGDADSRGLRGHLAAVLAGRITTGAVKVVGLAVTATAAAVARTGSRDGQGRSIAIDVVADTVLVAGAANLVNLFDLRPGRAAKATAAGGLLLSATAVPTTCGAVAGALTATTPDDLAARTMLGDAGANALGAVLAAGFADVASRRARIGAAVVVSSLTLLSERVSFSAVIAANPLLARLDLWGRPDPGGR